MLGSINHKYIIDNNNKKYFRDYPNSDQNLNYVKSKLC